MDPLSRPRFGLRLLVVSLTWVILAIAAQVIGPAAAAGLGVIFLGMTARAAWQARRSPGWHNPDAQLGRQVATAAALLAAGFAGVTLISLRHLAPPWLLWLQGGALLHYWLLALAGV